MPNFNVEALHFLISLTIRCQASIFVSHPFWSMWATSPQKQEISFSFLHHVTHFYIIFDLGETACILCLPQSSLIYKVSRDTDLPNSPYRLIQLWTMTWKFWIIWKSHVARTKGHLSVSSLQKLPTSCLPWRTKRACPFPTRCILAILVSLEL